MKPVKSVKKEKEVLEVVFETYDMELYFKAQNLLRDSGIGYETKIKTSLFRSNIFRTASQGGDAYKLAVRTGDAGRAREALRGVQN